MTGLRSKVISPFALSHDEGAMFDEFQFERGFTYIGLLFAIVLLGILLSTAGVLWETQARREKEQQLLFVGTQYQQAITSYHSLVVNGVNQFPPTIDDLLLDSRFPMPVRHLRKRYVDPVTNSQEWGLVRDGAGIIAVYSLSSEVPLKRADFGSCCPGFQSARNYSDWKFAFH